ncbi:hypothetical protein BJY17_001435 [Agromyces hippuratus]|uniref:Modulator of FtsH protease n=1 Tax=Agromyces hippuratus TaxID=286438 RepID=A0A852WT13_9MICO|nr:hypothetical protein [Agromyces hippuratus]NYG20688.1 hypothetical protein [Agromyces hippuratus]
MTEPLASWSEFNVAMVGATAALAGLLIVAMSVNIAEIMKSVTLPPRAASSIAALVLAITASAFGLIPGQPVTAYGIEVLVAALIAALFQVHAIRVVAGERGVAPMERLLKSIAGVLPVAAFLAGAVLVIVGTVEVGLIAMAIGSVLSIIAALIIAWVVLVEVLR